MYDIEDERGVPISSGVPPIVTYAGIAGVVLIFIIAALVLGASAYGHLWPSENTLNLKL
jgi:hypothetical protein